jgi:hypothetical protein
MSMNGLSRALSQPAALAASRNVLVEHAIYRGRRFSVASSTPAPGKSIAHSILQARARAPDALQPGHLPRRRFSAPSVTPQADVVAEFAAANALSARNLAEIRRGTQGFTFVPLAVVKDPVVAGFLKKAIVDPMKAKIQQDPRKSSFQNEDVVKLNSASAENQFSNYAMHLAEGGQDGIHIHPYGSRNLVIIAAGDWSMLCTREPQEGEDPAAVRDVVEVQFKPGVYIATFPKGRPHGFKSAQPDTVAISIHASDLQEVVDAGLPKDSKDSMAQLTRDLGSDGLRVIAKVPADVVLAMHPPAVDPD